MATRTHCARIATLLRWQNISLCALLISRSSYFATFVWVWNFVSHTKGTTPTESAQGAEEGVDLNEAGSSRGVERRNGFTGQMILEAGTMRWVEYVARAVEYERP